MRPVSEIKREREVGAFIICVILSQQKRELSLAPSRINYVIKAKSLSLSERDRFIDRFHGPHFQRATVHQFYSRTMPRLSFQAARAPFADKLANGQYCTSLQCDNAQISFFLRDIRKVAHEGLHIYLRHN